MQDNDQGIGVEQTCVKLDEEVASAPRCGGGRAIEEVWGRSPGVDVEEVDVGVVEEAASALRCR